MVSSRKKHGGVSDGIQRPITAGAAACICETCDMKLAFLWMKPPTNAIFHRRDDRKWFAELLPEAPGRRLEQTEVFSADILDLRCAPKLTASLMDSFVLLPETGSLIDISYAITRT